MGRQVIKTESSRRATSQALKIYTIRLFLTHAHEFYSNFAVLREYSDRTVTIRSVANVLEILKTCVGR